MLKSRILPAIALATVLGMGSAVAVALPASAVVVADPIDVNTASVSWEEIDTATGYVEDGNPYDFARAIYGNTNDSFDGIPYSSELSDGDNTWEFIADTSVSDINAGGTSTITMTGNTGNSFAEPFTVVLTLTLQGNYARWAYSITSDADVVDPAVLASLQLNIHGDVGSDRKSTYIVSGDSMVSNDSVDESDPIIAYQASTNGTFGGWNVTDGNEDVIVSATGASQFAFTVAVIDYAPLGLDDAKALAASIAPTLLSTFGAVYDAQTGATVVFAPATATAGIAVNQTLPYTVDESYTGYFDPANDVTADVSAVPAGLTIVPVRQADGSFVFTVTGTPTASGTFPVRIEFSVNGGAPIVSFATITIAAAAVPALAATGLDLTPAVSLAGGLAVLGALLFLIARRRKSLV